MTPDAARWPPAELEPLVRGGRTGIHRLDQRDLGLAAVGLPHRAPAAAGGPPHARLRREPGARRGRERFLRRRSAVARAAMARAGGAHLAASRRVAREPLLAAPQRRLVLRPGADRRRLSG